MPFIPFTGRDLKYPSSGCTAKNRTLQSTQLIQKAMLQQVLILPQLYQQFSTKISFILAIVCTELAIRKIFVLFNDKCPTCCSVKKNWIAIHMTFCYNTEINSSIN